MTRGVPPRRPFRGGVLNPVVRSTLAVILAAPLVVARPATAAGGAGTVPGAATLERLRQAAGPGVRVIGTSGQKEIRRPILDSTGVSSAEWAEAAAARPALFVTPDAPHPAAPAPIPWSDIQEIKTSQQHKTRGAVIGGVLGLGLVLAAIGTSDGNEEAGAAGGLVAGPVLGALIGTFIGSLTGSKTIYRAQENH